MVLIIADDESLHSKEAVDIFAMLHGESHYELAILIVQ